MQDSRQAEKQKVSFNQIKPESREKKKAGNKKGEIQGQN